MQEIKHRILSFFGSINEYDKRTYLRDCVDIMVFNHSELMKHYPDEVFLFLKLARISKLNLANQEFLEFINKETQNEDREINYFIYHTMCKGIQKAHSFNESLNKLKATNENLEKNKYSYEPSL